MFYLSSIPLIWQRAQLPRRVDLGSCDHQHDASRSLGEQRVLITGATRENGLGYNALQALVPLGHRIATQYRCEREDPGYELIARHYPHVMCTKFDLTSFSEQPMSMNRLGGEGPFEEYAQWVQMQFGKLDAVVLNAGETGLAWSPHGRRGVRGKANDWILSNKEMIDSLLPLLHDFDSRVPRGRLLFVSSAQADRPQPGVEPYGMIKRETEAYLRKLFSGNKRLRHVLPIIVLPGSCATQMDAEVMSRGPEGLREWRRELWAKGLVRDPALVGRIIAGIALTGCMYNPQSGKFDEPIERLARVEITNEVYAAFAQQSEDAMRALPRLNLPNE